MNATLYTLTAQEVQLVNSFTHLRNAAGPAHFIGDGYALVGAARRELLAQLSAAPWWLRVWRALGLRPAWPAWRWPAF